MPVTKRLMELSVGKAGPGSIFLRSGTAKTGPMTAADIHAAILAAWAIAMSEGTGRCSVWRGRPLRRAFGAGLTVLGMGTSRWIDE